MTKKKLGEATITLDTFVGGGQVIGTLPDGKKIFVWGGLPGETVLLQVTKLKKHYAEGVVLQVLTASPKRQVPRDPDSFLSTSPWQLLSLEDEQHIKATLITEAFNLHAIQLATAPVIYTDHHDYAYRNKIEFSFWYDADHHILSLAFFRRGSHGKIAVSGTSLVPHSINDMAHQLLALLNEASIEGWQLKTVILRITQTGTIAWQLYVKDIDFPVSDNLLRFTKQTNGEIIYSEPKSPASVITKRLTPRQQALEDVLLGVTFQYATESFFQINIPVYEQALKDIGQWVISTSSVLDLYSGVGSIGLTVPASRLTLVEINKQAVNEMKQNIIRLQRDNAHAVLAPSEKALDYIAGNHVVIVDPPRAGLHAMVIDALLANKPSRIIYLSCNPTTQARDIQLLGDTYRIIYQQGYNFFPHTPHIENLIVLDLA